MRSMRALSLWVLVGACGGCLGVFGPGGGGGGGGGSDDAGGGGGGGGNSDGSVAGDPHAQHNLDVLNQYRAQNGAAPLVLDDRLSEFSATASQMLHDTGQ